MKRVKLLFFLLICSVTSSYAQWSMGIGVNTVLPQGVISQQNYPLGIGGDFTLLSPTVLNKESNFKLQFGINFGGSDNGRKSFKTNGQFEEGSLNFYNCIANSQVTSRLTYIPHPRFSLFSEIIASRTLFHSGLNEVTETDDSYNHYHKVVASKGLFRYGAGFGGSYYVNHLVRLDLRFDYTKGESVEFIDMSSTRRTEDGYNFDKGTASQSDLVNIQLRVSWLLRIKQQG